MDSCLHCEYYIDDLLNKIHQLELRCIELENETEDLHVQIAILEGCNDDDVEPVWSLV